MALQIKFDVDPNSAGMVDGMELAYELIRHAVRHINPYVHKCPACLDAVFNHIANSALNSVYEDMQAGGDRSRDSAMLLCFAPPENRDEIIRDGLHDAQAWVQQIVTLHSTDVAHQHLH